MRNRIVAILKTRAKRGSLLQVIGLAAASFGVGLWLGVPLGVVAGGLSTFAVGYAEEASA